MNFLISELGRVYVKEVSNSAIEDSVGELRVLARDEYSTPRKTLLVVGDGVVFNSQ